MIHLNQETSNLFVVLVKWLFTPGCKKFLWAAFPWYGKEGILLPNQTSPHRNENLEYLYWDGNTGQGTSAQRAKAIYLFISCNVVENSRVEKGKGFFLEHKCIWAGVFSHSWIHVAIMLLPISSWGYLCKGCFALVVWTSYVLLIPNIKEGFLMPPQSSPQRRTLWECLLSDGKSVQ